MLTNLLFILPLLLSSEKQQEIKCLTKNIHKIRFSFNFINLLRAPDQFLIGIFLTSDFLFLFFWYRDNKRKQIYDPAKTEAKTKGLFRANGFVF